MAASATFALNAELCVRRARLAIVTPDLRHSRRLQAETPLIDLSEFGQPALTSPVRSARFRPIYRPLMFVLVADFALVGAAGAHRPEGMWLVAGQVCTA